MGKWARKTLAKDWAKSLPADILKRARKVVALAHGDSGLASTEEYSFEIYDVAVYLWELLRPEEAKARLRVLKAETWEQVERNRSLAALRAKREAARA